MPQILHFTLYAKKAVKADQKWRSKGLQKFKMKL